MGDRKKKGKQGEKKLWAKWFYGEQTCDEKALIQWRKISGVGCDGWWGVGNVFWEKEVMTVVAEPLT